MHHRIFLSFLASTITLPLLCAENPPPEQAPWRNKKLIAGCVTSAAIAGTVIYALMNKRVKKATQTEADLNEQLNDAIKRMAQAEKGAREARQSKQQAEQQEQFAKQERNAAYDELHQSQRKAQAAIEQLQREAHRARELARELEATKEAQQKFFDETMDARKAAAAGQHKAQAADKRADQESSTVLNLQQRLAVANDEAARLQRLLTQRKEQANELAQALAAHGAALKSAESARNEAIRLRRRLEAAQIKVDEEEEKENGEAPTETTLSNNQCGICFDAFQSNELISLHQPEGGDQSRHQACIDCLVGYGLVAIDRKDAKGRPISLYVRKEQPSPFKERPSHTDPNVWIPVMEDAKCFGCRKPLTPAHIAYAQDQANIIATENAARKD